MAAGPGSTDAENGVKMAARDRFTGTPGSTGPGQEPDAPGSASPEPDGPHGEQAEERLEIYGDSSYGSGEARAVYRDAGHDTVIKPGPLRPAVPSGFTIDDFTVDEEHGTVTCQPGRSDEQDPDRHLRRSLRRLPATAAVHHREGRPVHDHPPARGPAARRPRPARTDDFKKAYPTRSAIERIISWTATQNGRRVRLRYLGTAKNNAWLHTRCAAITCAPCYGTD